MKPYYEQDGITIYHGDCREVLLTLDVANPAVVSDPPYGIDFQPDRQRANRPNGGGHMWAGVRVVGDDESFDPSFLLALGAPSILWGGNNYADKLPIGGWLVWDKTPRGVREGWKYSHCELAWTNIIRRIEKFSLGWNAGERDGEPFFHPTQKSEKLMAWCIGYVEVNRAILDPFAGSGTTLIAAKHLGRRAIGIEIEERYCEIAANRLAQGVLFGTSDPPTPARRFAERVDGARDLPP